MIIYRSDPWLAASLHFFHSCMRNKGNSFWKLICIWLKAITKVFSFEYFQSVFFSLQKEEGILSQWANDEWTQNVTVMDALEQLNMLVFKKIYINGHLKNLLIENLIQNVTNNMKNRVQSKSSVKGYFYSLVSILASWYEFNLMSDGQEFKWYRIFLLRTFFFLSMLFSDICIQIKLCNIYSNFCLNTVSVGILSLSECPEILMKLLRIQLRQ